MANPKRYGLFYCSGSPNSLTLRWAAHMHRCLTERGMDAFIIPIIQGEICADAIELELDVLVYFNCEKVRAIEKWQNAVHILFMDDIHSCDVFHDDAPDPLGCQIIYSALPPWIWDFGFKHEGLLKPLIPGGEIYSGPLYHYPRFDLSFFGGLGLFPWDKMVVDVRGESISHDRIWEIFKARRLHWADCKYSEFILKYIEVVAEISKQPFNPPKNMHNMHKIIKVLHGYFKQIERSEILMEFTKSGRKVGLFGEGNGWLENSRIRPFYRGHLAGPAEYTGLMKSSHGSIHHGLMTLHYRSMDTLANECNLLCNRTQYDLGAWDIRNYFEHGVHYYEFDSDNIQEDVERFLRDYREGELGARAAPIHAQKFTWNHCVDNMILDIATL
jgi:hypothetical protein